ncbi:MAG: hypothetical protein EOO29_14195 [Comamonadaceae bacterium]|nr:MAG: hypothetical protein EOO29_14195 [Comamonadaceae bacterium]
MKLVHDTEGRIVATATMDYAGPDLWIDAPEGFDIDQSPRWRVVDGGLVLAVPQAVSRAQGKAALIGAQKWGPALAFVAAIEDSTQRALAGVALHDTLEWRRDSAFLAAAAQALGMSPADLDALFIAASEIHL